MQLVSLLFATAFCERNYFTLNHDNWKDVNSAHDWVLVRFYTQHQEQSVRSFEDYNLVGKAFENSSDVLVAGLDCGKYRRECLRHKAFEIPSVHLYDNKNGVDYLYDGGQSFESIIQFVKNHTNAESKPVHQLVASPNARTFRDMVKDNPCVLAFFWTPWCGACKRFMPRLRRVARLFKDEPSVKFAEVDADRYRSFLREYDLKTYPDIRLFVRGEKNPIEYDNKRSAALVTEFINKHCGTRMDVSKLEAEAGLIDEANSVVEDFYQSGKKPMYVQKMKAVPRASYYVSVMEGVLENGNDFLLEQKSKWTEMMEQETTSPKEKDILQKKMNIISFFEEIALATA